MVCVPDLLRSVCQLFAVVLCPPVKSVLRLLCLHHCWLDHYMSVGCGALPARLNLLPLHRMMPVLPVARPTFWPLLPLPSLTCSDLNRVIGNWPCSYAPVIKQTASLITGLFNYEEWLYEKKGIASLWWWLCQVSTTGSSPWEKHHDQLSTLQYYFGSI